VTWHHEVRGDETAPRREQPLEHRLADRERRVGDDPEGPPPEPEIRCVRLDDRDLRAGEARPEEGRPSVVTLDGDDDRAGAEQRGRQRARAGADVEDELSGSDRRVGHERRRPALIEAVPPPGRRRAPGHGRP
jgi:hypothetical protein